MLNNVRKSVVLTNNGKFVVTEVPLKSPQNDEVTVDIMRAGVCSSDIERSFSNGAYHYPLVMGHELAGKVSSTSIDNDTFSVGDRVAVFPLLPCFSCSSCEHQHYALCKQYSYYGSRQDGGFANQLNVNVWNLIKLPDGVSFDDAALIEPMAVVLHAIKKLDLSHQQSDKICIIGAGFLGLLAVMLIRQEFPDLEITLIDRNPEKLAIGAQYNVDTIVLRDEDDWTNYLEIAANTFGKVIEFVGAPLTFKASINLCEQAGRVVWVGNITGNVDMPKSMVSSILRKEIILLGSWNSFYKGDVSCDWQDAIDLMVKGMKPSALITNTIALEEIPETLEKLFHHKTRQKVFRTVKVMVEVN